MQDRLQILLLGIDSAALTDTSEALNGLRGISIACTEGTFANGTQLARAETPGAVMIVMDGDARAALSLMQEINRTLPATQVFGLSRDDTTENIVKAMRAGATEFLSLPVDSTQLLTALIKATALRRLAQPIAAAGKIWTVYSPKGGAGVTTTAANLAIEAHGQLGKSVCLVDLDFQAGDLALALNLNPVYSFTDIALNFQRLDSVFLQGTLTRHPSGIYLLAAPPYNSLDTRTIPAEQIRTVLELLKSMYDVTIVDTARSLSNETLMALSSASRVVLLLTLSLPFLRGYRRTMEVLEAAGVPRDDISVVVARHGASKAEVALDEAKKSLELAVTYLLPRDDDTALTAVNKGLPLVEVKRSSPLRQGIVALAELLTGEGQTQETKAHKGLLRGLFSS
jgi:pilus assembly protein CpaE